MTLAHLSVCLDEQGETCYTFIRTTLTHPYLGLSDEEEKLIQSMAEHYLERGDDLQVLREVLQSENLETFRRTLSS